MEQKLLRQNETLLSKVEDKSQGMVKSERLATIGIMASRVAHDLKNPLTIMHGGTKSVSSKACNLCSFPAFLESYSSDSMSFCSSLGNPTHHSFWFLDIIVTDQKLLIDLLVNSSK